MASQGPAGTADTTFCRECGKPIEADARFCRFCGKPQTERGGASVSSSPVRPSPPPPPPPPPRPASTAPARRPVGSGSGDGLEQRLRQLFPRHHLQDEFMHIGSIAAFFMALIGFILGFFPAYSWLADNFLLGAVALLLFLILRESTLSHIRARGGEDPGPTGVGTRYQASRPATGSGSGLPPEAATTQSSPPSAKPPRA